MWKCSRPVYDSSSRGISMFWIFNIVHPPNLYTPITFVSILKSLALSSIISHQLIVGSELRKEPYFRSETPLGQIFQQQAMSGTSSSYSSIGRICLLEKLSSRRTRCARLEQQQLLFLGGRGWLRGMSTVIESAYIS